MKLLHIDSSILGTQSATRELGAAIVGKWRARVRAARSATSTWRAAAQPPDRRLRRPLRGGRTISAPNAAMSRPASAQ
jgi:hypothetical protein